MSEVPETPGSAPPHKPPEATYVLRAPKSGMGVMDPRSALLLWGVGSILLGLLIMWLLVRGEFRMLMLVVLGFLGLVSLAPRRGVFILTAFLPFMYLVRRLVLEYQDFSQRDPILLFPAATTAAIAVGVMVFYGPTLLHYIQRSGVLRAATLLMGVFILQVFNPLQGNILVGVAGALYFIIPLLWVYFGLVIDREDMPRLLTMVLVIGVITAVYGLYQHYFGLSEVEIYEMRSKNFLKAFGDVREARVMSTFSGLVDFARYLSITGFLAFAWFWRRRNNPSYLLLLILMLWAMLFTASRSALLTLVFSIVMMLVLRGASMRQIIARGVVVSLLVVAMYAYFYRNDPRRVYNQQFSSNPFVVHTLSGVTHPTEESSFRTRLRIWVGITRAALFDFPLGPIGHGLGSTTTAASKFEGGQGFEADSFYFEIIYGSGILAGILFTILAVLLFRDLLQLCLTRADRFIYQICFGLLCGIALSSVFGVAPRDTVSGPLCWLIIGWIVRETVDEREGVATVASEREAAPAGRISAPAGAS